MDKLERLRAERGLTITELAEKARVARTTLSLLEGGHRKARSSTIGKIALALGVPLDDLIDYMDDTAPERGRLGGRPKQIAAWLISHQQAA